jgi:hypothetical protein
MAENWIRPPGDGFSVTATTSITSTASRFDRALARHLAARIAEGARCNEPIVRQCYVQARQELQISGPAANDSCADEFESGFVSNAVGLMETHQNFLLRMPEIVAGIFIAELLLDKPW